MKVQMKLGVPGWLLLHDSDECSEVAEHWRFGYGAHDTLCSCPLNAV
jgi:hypothetical protein